MDVDPRASRNVAASRSNLANQEPDEDGKDVHAADVRSTNHERWTKLPKTRGRQPKDPHAQSVRFTCRDIDDLERQLRDYLQNPTAPAEHATLEFVYPVSSAFSVYAADIRNKRNVQQDEKAQHLYGKLERSAISVIDALAQTKDPKDQMRRQKAIAKVCIEACERADGFRYSFHNNWLSREDEACRFSYFCNDSTLNKGRAANEGANAVGKKMRKAVYDCQGLIAIKFSSVKKSLEVHYRHIPVHKTYEERAPPARKDSKRYKLMEIFEPGKLLAKQSKRPKSQPSADAMSPQRSRKRRATENPGGPDAMGHVVSLPSAGFDAATGVGSLDSGPLNVPVRQYVRTHNGHQLDQDPQFSVPPALPHAHDHPMRPLTDSRKRAAKSLSKSTDQAPLAWAKPNEVRTASVPTRNGEDVVTRPGSIETSTTVDRISIPNPTLMSDLEALKAKLEAAEQRIKNLEAEKQSLPPTQPPPWGSYPHPAPPPPPHPPVSAAASSYPYGYQPSSYPYPPTTMIPGGYPPVSTMPQAVPYHHTTSHPEMIADKNTSKESNAHQVTLNNVKKRTSSQISKPGNVRAFVAYTPKPQRPVLHSQRQDSNHTVTNTTTRQIGPPRT